MCQGVLGAKICGTPINADAAPIAADKTMGELSLGM
jgi:hypothetical protein